MGCTSSTEVVRDPYTGEIKKKHRLGGAYPGNRRTHLPSHEPFPEQYTQVDGTGVTSTATLHFVAYGGGNALTLMEEPSKLPAHDANAEPSDSQAEYISVTLPEGVEAGDTIHVQSPGGGVNAVVVPMGLAPGDTFTVDFQRDSLPPPTAPVLSVHSPEANIGAEAEITLPPSGTYSSSVQYPTATSVKQMQ